MESRIAYETTRRVRTISFEEAFELVERLRALEQNIGAAAMVVMAIREHASAGGDVSPIKLSLAQAEAVVAAVVRWSRESGDVPEDVDLLGQALVAELR